MRFSHIILIGLAGAMVSVIGLAYMTYRATSTMPKEADYPDLLLCQYAPDDLTYAQIYNERCAEALLKYRVDFDAWAKAR